MATELYCQVTDTGLVPAYDSDYETYHRLRKGSVVRVNVANPRNYRFHKKFFALLRIAYDNLPENIQEYLNVHSLDDMLRCVKIDLGLFHTVQVNGREAIEYDSISFAGMDNTEFERFYEQTINLILYRYLPGTERNDLINEIENFI